MSGPTTEAGRALYDAMRESASGLPERLAGMWPYRDAILAIEREAVAAFLASPEAAEGLATALHNSDALWHKGLHTLADCQPESFAGSYRVQATDVLAAWQQERGQSS